MGSHLQAQLEEKLRGLDAYVRRFQHLVGRLCWGVRGAWGTGGRKGALGGDAPLAHPGAMLTRQEGLLCALDPH